jgi:hypothetical protein
VGTSQGLVTVHKEIAALMRRRSGLDVSEIPADGKAGYGLPALRQDNADVHGSHGLFYWLRARGRGLCLSRDGAGLVLAWRGDVGRLVALRPVGTLDAAADVLTTVANVVSGSWPRVELVVRYCTGNLADRLSGQGWTALARPWVPLAPLDDEAFPEVVITADPVELPAGQRFKPVRESVFAHAAGCQYYAAPVPLRCGEATFIQAQATRPDRQEAGFNQAVLAALTFRRHDKLAYHYLFRGGSLQGFAITGNTTGTSHGYYLSTVHVPRLATYFLWQIYRQERRTGAHALNLGGSECESLHLFKARTFPGHQLQRTHILQYPASA